MNDNETGRLIAIILKGRGCSRGGTRENEVLNKIRHQLQGSRLTGQKVKDKEPHIINTLPFPFYTSLSFKLFY